MNDILTLDDLARLLAVKHNIGKEDANRLLESFLNVIEKGLLADRYVRIKGFGTFKLIENVADANAASTNKIIFVPDVDLKETINKPFSHFEPVVLNENVSFDDIEEQVLADGQEQDADSDVASEMPVGHDIHGEEVSAKETEPESATEHISEPERVSEPENISEPESEKKEEAEPESVSKIESVSAKPGTQNSIPWCLMILVLIIGLSLGGIISWLIFSGNDMPVQTNTEKNVIEPAAVMDAVPAVAVTVDSAMVGDSVVVANNTIVEKTEIDSILKSADAVKNVPESVIMEEPVFLSEKLTYRITGTIEKHTIEKGNTLAKIAYKYYRNKKMWPYIVMHNKNIIKDPNNVPIGTVINIPRLEAME